MSVIIAICKNDETFRTPIHNEMERQYDWLVMKMIIEGRLPNEEYMMHTRQITRIARSEKKLA